MSFNGLTQPSKRHLGRSLGVILAEIYTSYARFRLVYLTYYYLCICIILCFIENTVAVEWPTQ